MQGGIMDMISSEISTAGPYELRSYQGSFVKMYFDATVILFDKEGTYSAFRP